MKYIVLGVMLFFGCGKAGDRDDRPPFNIPQELTDKFELYQQLIEPHQDENGFLYTDKCDSLLFTSLVGVALPQYRVTIEAAIDGNGQWFRRPNKDCLEKSESKSSISRDMLLGLYYYIWKHKRLDLAEDLYQYGLDHNWVMGDHDGSVEGVSRVILSPPMISTLAEMIYKLGGQNHIFSRNLPVAWEMRKTGFRSHLLALHLILRKKVFQKLSRNGQNVLRQLYIREPNNPLFAIGINKCQEAANILLNEKWWPSERLPTTIDRCAEWLPEQRFEKWEPCTDKVEIHTGGDLLFIYQLLKEF